MATRVTGAEEMIPSRAKLCEMFRRMLRVRAFEESASKLIAEAKLPGVLHNCIGQEATVVGACMALRDDDYMTGNHRSHGHPIAKGVSLAPLMAELFGKSTGVCRGKGGSMHLAAFAAGSLGESGIVGSLMPVAVGAGLSARLRDTDQVCLCFFGDGAANCGPFHESLNLAAIWKLPVVFLCENNGYALYTPQAQSTSVAHIAQRASAYGIPGAILDGQDVLAVYSGVMAAVLRAREGGGPSLVESKTYRYCEHYEAGGPANPPIYRSEHEIAAWRARDPIRLFAAHLQSSAAIGEREIEAITSEVLAEVDEAVAFAEQSAAPNPSALFEDVFT
ncbi:thiamine pyrophosphate-dependent dehydrogenase E1 component subunit alpha [Steroidobacter sp. S1-65]|uniref:Thiamine pyrophosphate-dependent dehydrogenase E1 component subunit alpha n=1 Tax=Steroidobacter gossypii TaxID=2805490 RepID=A0ABS1X6K9_9GAMM|nr:thiamine pyrophosphate-dependent dehydrogenase E1 component subunit alpha [Steroidobacter gossypii]MBM0108858.1 thiamine pyrophosphate-dependent dehydrogenase E1 component subunit alpha [Steroidobacter gossypii]